MILITLAVLFVILDVVINPVTSTDCVRRPERCLVKVSYRCTAHTGWWFWKSSHSKICYRYEARSHLVNNCQGRACGGCDGVLDRDRSCDIDNRFNVSCRTAYRTCTSGFWWGRGSCSTRYRIQYKTKTTPEKYCCPGMTLIDSNTCKRCGINKYGSVNTLSASLRNNKTGDISPLIIGGHTAQAGEIPWQVLVYTKRTSGDFALCGGVILSSRWIITAAHCVQDGILTQSVVFVGDYKLSETDSSEVKHSLERMVQYPQYVDGKYASDYDIALIKTKSSIKFNDDVLPICLPNEPMSYIGRTVVISGWGYTSSPPGNISDVLKYTYAEVVSSSLCSTSSKNVICAQGESSSTACYSESGGPMTVKENGHSFLVGIAWFVLGGNCSTNSPFAYTNVGAYMSWIKNKIN